MNTLVIGNGFDLAHKLPTSYKDFIKFFNFCDNFITVLNGTGQLEETHIEDYLEKNEFNPKIVKHIMDKFSKRKDIHDIVPDFLLAYFNTYRRNCWYEYYKAIIRNDRTLTDRGIAIKGDNWVDFEKEIARVVNKIEDEMITGKVKGNERFTKNDLKKYLGDGEHGNGYGLINYMCQPKNVEYVHKKEFITYIRKQLDEFINMMDSYIDFISDMDIGNEIPDFKNKDGSKIKFNRVISFNYSKTFEEKYKDYLDTSEGLEIDEMIEYAHGKAGGDHLKEPYISNLVLGCEDTLDGFEANKYTECAYFKKYMQRDIKNTARNYTHFYDEKIDYSLDFDEKKEYKEPEINTAYIFGHTLDVNDGDIIRFVIEKNQHIVIFYHTYDDIISKTQNLIKILGKEKYIETKWKIENRAQLPMDEKAKTE